MSISWRLLQALESALPLHKYSSGLWPSQHTSGDGEPPCLIEEARKPLYGLGKYTAEELCKVYCRDRKVAATIFRFWWAFGDTISGRHLRDLVKKALNHQPLEMVRGAGGTFLTMTDLGKAMDEVLAKEETCGQVYNVGSLFITWEEIGEMMIRLTNSKSSIDLIPSDRWKGPAFLNECGT